MSIAESNTEQKQTFSLVENDAMQWAATIVTDLPSGDMSILEVSLKSTPMASLDSMKPKPYLLE